MQVGDGCGHGGVDNMCSVGRISHKNKFSVCTLIMVRLFQTSRLTGKITKLPTFFKLKR